MCILYIYIYIQVDSGEEAADDMNDDGLAVADDDDIAV
jgi:hypothetical protein